MQNAGYVALSRQISLTRQLAVTANNIANIDSVAFKRQGLMFAEHLAEAGGGKASYVSEVGTYRDLKQGALRSTERDLDIAIDGKGYLAYETPGGVRYGRNGQLHLGANGDLLTREGHRLLNADGEAINIPGAVQRIKFMRDGAVLADDQQIARIQVVDFENPQGLVHTADGLFRSDDGPGAPAEGATLEQGFLERSNVNPVYELVHMLNIQRDHSSTHKMTKGEHDRLTRAIREIGRVEQA